MIQGVGFGLQGSYLGFKARALDFGSGVEIQGLRVDVRFEVYAFGLP